MSANFSSSEAGWLDRIAHDLRGPLSPIRSAVQLLRSGNVEDEQTPTMFDLIDRQLDELMELIDDISDRLSLERDSFQCRLQPADLRSVADIIAVKYRRRLAAQDLSVEIETPDEEVDVRCDPRRLNQLLGYLIRHIAAAQTSASRIVIAARAHPPCLLLRFADGEQAVAAALQRIGGTAAASDAPLSAAVLQRIVSVHGLVLGLHPDETGVHVEIRFPDPV